MPTNSMDYWTIGGVIIAAIALYIAWRQFRKPKARIEQTMTNSRGSSQTATKDDVKQTMDNATDGDQNA